MDVNLLIQRLRHGDSYIVQDGDNDPYQVTNPPNHIMIKGAEAIMQLSNQLQQSNEVILNLQRQLNELAQQYELLQKSNAVTEPSPAN